MKLIYKLLLSMILLLSTTYASEEIPTKEEVAKLYVATFNRAPDAVGLNYWINDSFEGHPKLSDIAQSFFDQPETKALYPANTTIRSFIQSVYNNLFNRLPDATGWDYWEQQLSKNVFSRNSFIEAIINGAQNTNVSNDIDILNNKTIVGLSFAEAGLSDPDDARTIMIGVNDDLNTVASTVAAFGISLYKSILTTPIGSLDLSGYSAIYIFKGLEVSSVGTVTNSYQNFNGFASSFTSSSTSCTDFNFTNPIYSSPVAGIQTKVYLAGTRACYEVDYSGSPYQSGSANLIAYWNL